MPARKQPARHAHATTAQLDPEVLAKRTKRHLDELERSNYTESSALFPGLDDDADAPGGRSAKGRARQTISDKREWDGKKRKKSTMNVRTAVLYKKSLATLQDESGIANMPPGVPRTSLLVLRLLGSLHACFVRYSACILPDQNYLYIKSVLSNTNYIFPENTHPDFPIVQID
ncbi:hypothetical protein A0H81_07740 [Grifola frondosa]|uniref:Uncharacterized protein n=1 Tax=Grifola frondosa TaxID=5627 RepID=A0A1C7MAK3_GRIFR|nr:hypothetical protein A0H81_07740 [Grifola frondosa]